MRIGIDLGGTKIEGLALEGDAERVRVRVDTPHEYDATLEAVVTVVAELEQRAGAHGTVGVGIPGSVVPSTGLVKNANSVWLIGRPLGRDLQARLGRPVRVANDANCFVASEVADGAAAGAHVVFGVIAGTGTGAGIAVAGEVITGPNGVTGEWGHNPLPWPDAEETPGPLCYCGKHGCIETYLSGPGMTADHERRTGRRLQPPAIVAEAAAGDGESELTLQRYERRMARALGAVVNVIDPDVIVLGGGMSNIDRLYRAVPSLWAEYVFGATSAAEDRESPGVAASLASREVGTRLVRAVHGDASGVRGAARLWPDDPELTAIPSGPEPPDAW